MGKYAYSRVNGGVYCYNPEAPNAEKMVPMTDIECQIYDKWIAQLNKARKDGTVIPAQPKFPMTDVVADIEAVEVKKEVAPVRSAKARKAIKQAAITDYEAGKDAATLSLFDD